LLPLHFRPFIQNLKHLSHYYLQVFRDATIGTVIDTHAEFKSELIGFSDDHSIIKRDSKSETSDADDTTFF